MLRLLLAAILVATTLAAPAAGRTRSIDSIAREAGGTPRVARPKPPKPPKAWRPKWWPAAIEAGTGRAGIVIRLRDQRVYMHDGRRRWETFSCSTGLRKGTPRGTFRVVSKIRKPDWTYKGQHVEGGVPGNPLGVCWLGLGMPRSWRGAPIGMHGTNAPWFIGRPASHGCIRLRNQDALRLYKLVPIGTPVYIIP
ncbi:MAG: hypothetical protein JWM80_384 [Cyanobacteria bacterium RYN_339]|nr:hypothetical protein [Cyanobacteria bacterium RYN_339]